MKMKYAALSLLLTATSFLTRAQNTRLVGGINLANITVSGNGRVDETKMLTAFHVGILKDLRLADPLYIQTGLLYTGKGTKSQSGDPSSLNYSKATTNPYYIELPVNLILKTPAVNEGRFFAGAGPYIAAGVSGKMENEGKIAGVAYKNDRNIKFSNDDPTTLNYEEGAGFGILKRFDYGLNGTAGYEGKTLVLAVNYGLGLAKLQSGSNSSADQNNKHRVLGFSIGFKL